MDTSHDRVALTAAERRALAALEQATGGHDLGFSRNRWRSPPGPPACVRTGRVDVAAAVLFLAGAAMTVGTFTRWPLVAVVGVLMQACGLWWTLTRLAPRVGAWAAAKKTQAKSESRSTRAR